MRRPIVLGFFVALAVLILADAIAARAGVVAGFARSDGPWFWIASRAAGVTAFVALTLDVTFGLFLSTGLADAWIPRARSVELHRWLSASALALAALHALALAGDRFVRFDLLDALVPFLSSYRPFAVGLGVLALWLAWIVHASFSVRRRIGVARWRLLHYASFVVFVLAAAHGLLAGTDTARPWMTNIYIVAVATVVAMSVIRVARSHARRP
jgi:predicted ferric reductase